MEEDKRRQCLHGRGPLAEKEEYGTRADCWMINEPILLFNVLYDWEKGTWWDSPAHTDKERKYCFHSVTCQHQNCLPELLISNNKILLLWFDHGGEDDVGQTSRRTKNSTWIHVWRNQEASLIPQDKIWGRNSQMKQRSHRVSGSSQERIRQGSWESFQSKTNH